MFARQYSAAFVAFLSIASAHMKLDSPVPYGKGSLNNSPLDPSGSDFPCKIRDGVYEVSEMNFIEVGVPQDLRFIGGATHGGGSCQVSVCLDEKPTKESRWKVVHSIIGGCPSPNEGNLSQNPNDTGSSKYQFKLPQGMPNGRYTLAWSWLNKIGNREFYMNCAPITVTGGADDTKVFDSLPDMFVMNMPPEDCMTKEEQDFDYPDPGQSVERFAGANFGSDLIGEKCPSRKGTGSGTTSPEAPKTSDGGKSKNPGGVFAPVSPPVDSGKVVPEAPQVTPDAGITPGLKDDSAKDDSVAAQPESPQDDVSTTPGNNSTEAPALGTGQCTNGRVPCSNPRFVVCLDEHMFGICDIDGCATPQPLAYGSDCSKDIVESRVIRFPPHARTHSRRHASSIF